MSVVPVKARKRVGFPKTVVIAIFSACWELNLGPL